MNRFQHYLRATTQYGLHSPFVYALYTEVLFSRASGAPRGHGFDAVVWRLEHHYGVSSRPVVGGVRSVLLDTCDGEVLVVDRPHRKEECWRLLQGDERFRVTLDLFDCGLALANPHLSRQHFLLR